VALDLRTPRMPGQPLGNEQQAAIPVGVLEVLGCGDLRLVWPLRICRAGDHIGTASILTAYSWSNVDRTDHISTSDRTPDPIVSRSETF
jgi:hypothetical protein